MHFTEVPFTDRTLPWNDGVRPLMLAPMQGLTNAALRGVVADMGQPDVLFTEFVRVAPGNQSVIDVSGAKNGDRGTTPLVVQLIGRDGDALAAAAREAQARGAGHINLNLGCPYGRMTSAAVGGHLLARPEGLKDILGALRVAVTGSLSVKLRAGYDDPSQVLNLLPLLEDTGVDFIILHPRTVVQGYAGRADHAITAAVVERSGLPVIANGDIRTAADGRRVLHRTGATGLMLGRGGIADPCLFHRLRDPDSAEPDRQQRAALLRGYLARVADRYAGLFCGDTQVLHKLGEILALIDDPDFKKLLKKLKKARTLRVFYAALAGLE